MGPESESESLIAQVIRLSIDRFHRRLLLGIAWSGNHVLDPARVRPIDKKQKYHGKYEHQQHFGSQPGVPQPGPVHLGQLLPHLRRVPPCWRPPAPMGLLPGHVGEDALKVQGLVLYVLLQLLPHLLPVRLEADFSLPPCPARSRRGMWFCWVPWRMPPFREIGRARAPAPTGMGNYLGGMQGPPPSAAHLSQVKESTWSTPWENCSHSAFFSPRNSRPRGVRR